MTLLVVLYLFQSSCNTSNGYQKTSGGISWKLQRFSDSEKQVKSGSLVQFEWTVIDDNDREVYHDRMFIKIDSSRGQQGFFESLVQLKEQEQGLFLIQNKHLESDIAALLGTSEISLRPEGALKHQVYIDKTYSLEEFLHKRKAFLSWVNEQKPVNFNSVENQVIENYMINRNMKMKVSETGMYYEILHEKPSTATGFGKHVEISYRGGVLGKDDRHITTSQDFYIGQELQVIRAIEEVLLLMEKGDSATIIAPSEIAFGVKGSSTGLIPGSTPVFYGIRLLECD